MNSGQSMHWADSVCARVRESVSWQVERPRVDILGLGFQISTSLVIGSRYQNIWSLASEWVTKFEFISVLVYDKVFLSLSHRRDLQKAQSQSEWSLMYDLVTRQEEYIHFILFAGWSRIAISVLSLSDELDQTSSELTPPLSDCTPANSQCK